MILKTYEHWDVFYEFKHFDFTQSITAEHWQLRAVCKVGQHLAIPAAGKASRDTQFEGHWLLPHSCPLS